MKPAGTGRPPAGPNAAAQHRCPGRTWTYLVTVPVAFTPVQHRMNTSLCAAQPQTSTPPTIPGPPGEELESVWGQPLTSSNPVSQASRAPQLTGQALQWYGPAAATGTGMTGCVSEARTQEGP